jgi:hypothetical protein
MLGHILDMVLSSIVMIAVALIVFEIKERHDDRNHKNN